jgi:HK97 family phage prohead protease
MKKVQYLTLRSNVQLQEGEDGKKRLIGLIPYNKRSEYMGFYEYITNTAFNKTLSDGADVKALWDHDSSKVLGRVKNGSLILRSQDDGLYCEAILPDTTYARDAYNLIKDEYVQTMSFGFSPIQERVELEDGNEVRYLTEVKLSEISFGVAFPAYEATDSVARSIRGINIDKLSSILEKETLAEPDILEIKSTVSALNNLLPKEEVRVESQPITAAAESTDADLVAKSLSKLLDGLKELKTI